ncbi:conserved hypothetical protein [Leishmania major strain Friedlin]|uniref:Uncharacterized protein n=1 Tax=Leishmania major TaxID=5664 RepID=Q4QET1_LEIMA|nr:conserved hypothetical protein [Leishmania major strain Friedlin]CAG9572123.1 hypothetical_protein_-_conserved [Leishmania major strain Friedlin]CAJ03693.1 conserved hypothetical protein [Leishmania major strain Friedlin]|eukprot:XP_001682167.1 conserved hypothetical protein [Leishmania major strain Friedlin]
MHGFLVHGQASRGLMSAEVKKGYTGCRSYLMSAEDLGKGGRLTHSEILIANEAIIKQRREGVQVSEEYVRRLEGQARSTCLESVLSRSVEAARARCRETKRMRTWVSWSTQTLSKSSEPARVAQASYTMQTLVVVSAIYGVAFNERGMTPAENRDTALTLKRAFDCLLNSGVALARAHSLQCPLPGRADDGPRGPDVFNREQEQETRARQEESTRPQNGWKSGCRFGHAMEARPCRPCRCAAHGQRLFFRFFCLLELRLTFIWMAPLPSLLSSRAIFKQSYSQRGATSLRDYPSMREPWPVA